MNTSKRNLRSSLSSFLLLALVVVLVLCTAEVASACPSCKAALANQKGRGDLVSGFFYSILFMLSMPFAIFGSLSGYFYMLVRRARRQQTEQDSAVHKHPKSR